jgi:Histidine ammonia-lyase
MSLLLIDFISQNSPFHISESCLSWVPEQGSVGACGDLAPLAHLALGLLGEGKMWSPETGWGNAKDVRWMTNS